VHVPPAGPAWEVCVEFVADCEVVDALLDTTLVVVLFTGARV